jgi:hypothetical protein
MADMGPENQRRVSWKRVVISLLIIFLGLWVLAPVVNHVLVWNLARGVKADASPLMPQSLADTSLDPLHDGETIQALGFSLRLPWTVASQQNMRSLTTLKFANGASASVADMSDSVPGMLTSTSERTVFQSMYGATTLSSKYEFFRAEMNASPNDVFFWNSRAKNAGLMTLLSLKETELQKANVFYPIAFGQARGFQIGEAGSATVQLQVFDAQDRELWIIIHPTPAGVTQEQLNGLVASLRAIQ